MPWVPRRAIHQRDQLAIELGCELRERPRRLGQRAEHALLHRAAHVEVLAGRECEQRRPERVDVGARRNVVVVGELLGRPYGLSNERFSRSLWANAGVSVGAWWPATEHIAIGADAIGWVAFRRPAFDTAEGSEIVRGAPAGFALVAGAEARFGGGRRR